MQKNKPNRQRIYELIENDFVTAEDICTKLNITPAMRAQYFLQLRLEGNYPIPDEKGHLFFTDKKGWKEFKREKRLRQAKRGLKKRTVEEQTEFLKNRFKRCREKLKNAFNNSFNDPQNELLKHKINKAQAEYDIAAIEFKKFIDKHELNIAFNYEIK